jgi:hypothetical protein
MRNRMKTVYILLLFGLGLSASVPGAAARSDSDRFLLPQPNQPFEGKVETLIGTLEFSNQYPSKESIDTLLDSMGFHGATLA